VGERYIGATRPLAEHRTRFKNATPETEGLFSRQGAYLPLATNLSRFSYDWSESRMCLRDVAAHDTPRP